MVTKDQVWKSEQLGKRYLEGVRGAVPLAAEQIEVMLRIVREMSPDVRTFLDLGCGDGVLGRAILAQFPSAKGVLLDFSEFMVEQAKAKTAVGSNAVEFVVVDYAQKGWTINLGATKGFDVVVSGFSIHHQPDEKKQEIYREIYDLLNPGGVFLNLEHVASASKLGERMFDNYFVDALYDFHQAAGSDRSRDDLAEEYYHRPDKAANILAPVAKQCGWLEEIGYIHVDCFLKVFELALFGGQKPKGV